MNKFLTILIVALGISCSASHQQVYAQAVDNTQYYVNLPSVNPGFTGVEDFWDLKVSYRQQWNDFSNENSNIYASLFGTLGTTSPTAYKDNSLRISDPYAYDRLSNEKDLRRRHGIGGMLSSRTLGPFTAFEFNANYAYHIPISNSFSLSLGTKLGYLNHQLDFTQFTVRDEVNDAFFQMLMNANEGNQSYFTLDLGSILYSKSFYFGLSTNSLVNQKISGDDFNEFLTDQTYEVITGMEKQISTNMEIYPSARLRYSEIFDLNWEVNLRLRYKERIYIGGAYENDVRASFLFGLTLDTRYNINYSYDYFLNQLNDFNTGNHEVVIGIALFNKYSMKTKNW